MSIYDDFKISYPPPCSFRFKRYDNYDMTPQIVPSYPQSPQAGYHHQDMQLAPSHTYSPPLPWHLNNYLLKCSFSKGPTTKQIKQSPIILASKCRSPLKILKKKVGFAWNSQPVRHNVQCNFKFKLLFVVLTFPIMFQ